MKKFLKAAALLIAAMLIFTLAGCAADGEPAPIRDDELFTPDLSGADSIGNVKIDVSEEHQTIKGFGGINYPGWIDDLTADQRETTFKNGDDQLGFTILRIHVDPDRNNWEREIETAKYAQKQGALIFASPWNPPAEMCEKFDHNGNKNAQRLKHDCYADYAAHLNDFVTFMRDNGVELYAISIQNEPDYADDWTWWSTEEIMDFIKNYSDAIDCKVMSPEAFQYRKDFYNAILNDEDALSKIDVFGTHFYGTRKSDMAYPLFEEKGAGKELWMTEVYVPDSETDADVWPQAIEVAVNMHDGLVTGNIQAYVWWYIRRFYGPMKEDGSISKRGYMMAHYSKFVRPDYIRVGATKSSGYDTLFSAYKGDGKVIIVAINKSYGSAGETFDLSGAGKFDYIEAYTTDIDSNLERTGNIAFDGETFSYVLPASSVTTFVVSLEEE